MALLSELKIYRLKSEGNGKYIEKMSALKPKFNALFCMNINISSYAALPWLNVWNTNSCK
jgi:hypothetical protein